MELVGSPLGQGVLADLMLAVVVKREGRLGVVAQGPWEPVVV